MGFGGSAQEETTKLPCFYSMISGTIARSLEASTMYVQSGSQSTINSSSIRPGFRSSNTWGMNPRNSVGQLSANSK